MATPRPAGWGPGLGILTWCGYAGFLGLCRNAGTPLGPCEDLGKGRKRWLRLIWGGVGVSLTAQAWQGKGC